MTKKATTRKSTAADQKALASSYQRTPREQVAIDAHIDRRANTKPSPSMTVTMKEGKAHILPDHPDSAVGHSLLMEALGIAEADFLDVFLAQLAGVSSSDGEISERLLNFMLSVIKGIEPRDQVEAMLAAQMAATHIATMSFARRLNNAEGIKQQDSAERTFNKLSRTFTAQVEALKRYRTGGEQKMIVEHVNVHKGGQAIVGNITHPGGINKTEEQPHEHEPRSITDDAGTEMPCAIKANGAAMPSPGRSRA